VRLIQSRKGRYIRPKEKEKIKEVEEITGFKVEVI